MFFQVQIGLLGLLILSQLDFLLGSFLPAEAEAKFGFTGYRCELPGETPGKMIVVIFGLFLGETFSDNLVQTHYHPIDEGEEKQPGFFYWYVIIFF